MRVIGSTNHAGLPERAEVVVVGGGIMGTSAAFHLAEAGVPDVLLLERGQLASGSTSRAAGGVRAQFSDALNIEIGRRSLEAFANFGTRPGWEIDFRRVGYLFVLSRDEDAAVFERSVRLQNELGVPSRMVSAAAARELSPLLHVDDVVAAAFSPSDGHVTPEAAVHGYAHAARALGARIATGWEVVDIETTGADITGVVTNAGTIACGTVICAAGAWSGACAEMVGVNLPVSPVRRRVMFTEAIEGLPDELPMTIDFATSFYFHREGQGLLVGMSHDADPIGFGFETNEDWVGALVDVAERRAPSIATVGMKGGWTGLYEMSPDHNAMIGESASVSRFLYATGFSGHGLLQGPAVGEILRDLYLGRAPFVDVAPLSAERFDVGAERPEFNVV
jgi:sarcosine oxidase, subunit beta